MPTAEGKYWAARLVTARLRRSGLSSCGDLRDRGLDGVQLVMSDAHRGLVNAIGTAFQGASWQRCRVHFMRNVLAKVSKGNDEMVAATIRTIFAQPGQKEVRAQVDLVANMLASQFPAVAEMLLEAKADLTAFADFPHAHWRKIWSTNPIERLNREVKRRTDVVGILPNPAALLRLSSCVLIEAHDEWQDSDRRYPERGVHGPAHPVRTDRPGAQEGRPGHDPAEGDRRYGIVALTRRAARDELHHSRGRDHRQR